MMLEGIIAYKNLS